MKEMECSTSNQALRKQELLKIYLKVEYCKGSGSGHDIKRLVRGLGKKEAEAI